LFVSSVYSIHRHSINHSVLTEMTASQRSQGFLAPGTNLDFLPFSPDSMAHRVHRESVLLLGGGRALLMQIAHPTVARGVAEHSNFRTGRLNRLLRTLRPTLAIVLGTKEQALAGAASINRIHQTVTGNGYRATDPDLLLWVLATLIDTSLLMHELFIRPLTAEEAVAYYEDSKRIGSLLQLPPETLPADLDGLRSYTHEMSHSLQVTDEARNIAEALFSAGPTTWPVMRSIRQLTSGLLPEPLRDQFDLPWGSKREQALKGLEASSRVLLPRLPAALRAPPWFLTPNH
jgi:uncharacterized protein (DUF2236 family)